MRPRKTLSDQDRAVWAHYAAQLRLMPGRVALPPEPPPGALKASPAPMLLPVLAAERGPARRRSSYLVIGEAPDGLDKASWQKFRTGRLGHPRRIDLHGHTVQRAYEAFEHAVLGAAQHQTRLLEVITGRGSGEGGGILRRELPLWLNLPHLRPAILAATHPHAANTGAVWLLLRRC